MARGKLVKRYKRRAKRNPAEGGSAPRPNPPMFTDLVEFIGPGFASFAATRLATRGVAVQVGKRFPKFGKHAGAAASVGSFLAAWLLAHRWRPLEKYHTPIVVGAGLAALQSLVQIYLPRLGWIVSDCTPELAQGTDPNAAALAAGDQNAAALAAGDQPDFEAIDEGELERMSQESGWYSYNDARDPGQYASAPRAKKSAPQQKAAQQQATVQAENGDVFDVLDDEDGGIFAGEGAN